MKPFKALELRKAYLKFFEEHGHKVIPSSSLIPENDPSVLFTTAGMMPLEPYLLGQKHPLGTRLTDFQKCVRTNDIDEVGDNRHLTYFEMMGNWSLGDYFKEEAIAMSYEFLTKVLEINPDDLSVTIFAGNNDAPYDQEAHDAWIKAGIPEERIYALKDNWWIAGETGPCGGDTEMFMDTGKPACGPNCGPDCDCGKYVEIWNNVFMQFEKHSDGTLTKLSQHNVDTGLGLERVSMISQGLETPFDLEIFKPIMDKLLELKNTEDNISSRRIIAEHLRTSIMITADGGRPSNVDRGYILRRLIRRFTRHMNKLQINLDELGNIIDLYVDTLKELYPELVDKKDMIKDVIIAEKDKFMHTLANGEREFDKVARRLEANNANVIDGETMFKLYETYGFPPEITEDLAKEKGFIVEKEKFNTLMKEHQEKSRQGSEAKFKGGLAEQNEVTTKYHTATHLLNAALKKVVNPNIHQMGSNITVERMRFDFNCDHKLSDEEKKQVEDLVNEWINQGLDVRCDEMSKDDAVKSGAECMFIEKYPDIVTVYTIGDNVSKELCGGPHVKNTKEIGHFVIKKEESSSAGVRRIKAIVE